MTDSRDTARSIGITCALAAWTLLSTSVLAQAETTDVVRDMEDAAQRARQVPIIPADGSSTSRDANSVSLVNDVMRPALMREGAYLTDAVGRLRQDPQGGYWVFELDRTATGTDMHPTLIVLPSTRLNQMQRTVETSDLEIVFSVTGRVYVYGNRNYLLPLVAPTLQRYEERSAPEVPTDTSTDQPADPLDFNDLSADELIKRIREEVPLPRSVSDQTPTASTPDAADPEADHQEGFIFVRRRGHMLRNPDGGWRFVFEADASGQADPSVQLLPCLLLERMRDDALNQAGFDSMLLTGQVLVYRGRTFVMPTMYSIERYRTNIR